MQHFFKMPLAALLISTLIAVAGCSSDEPESTAVYIPPPPVQQNTASAFYSSPEECASASGYPLEYCQQQFTAAMQAHQQAAPHFQTMQDCQTQYGGCQSYHNSDGSSWVGPALAGAVIGATAHALLSNNRNSGIDSYSNYAPQPVYQHIDQRTHQPMGFQTANGVDLGSKTGRLSPTIAQNLSKPAKVPAMDMAKLAEAAKYKPPVTTPSAMDMSKLTAKPATPAVSAPSAPNLTKPATPTSPAMDMTKLARPAPISAPPTQKFLPAPLAKPVLALPPPPKPMASTPRFTPAAPKASGWGVRTSPSSSRSKR